MNELSFLQRLWIRVRSRVEYTAHRIVSGKEPLVVVGLIASAVSIAAKFGLKLDAEMIWLVLGILWPTILTGRNRVDPSPNPVTWLTQLRNIFVGPDIDLSDAAPGPAGVPVSASPIDGEPEWLDEYTNIHAEDPPNDEEGEA